MMMTLRQSLPREQLIVADRHPYKVYRERHELVGHIEGKRDKNTKTVTKKTPWKRHGASFFYRLVQKKKILLKQNIEFPVEIRVFSMFPEHFKVNPDIHDKKI